MPELRYGPEENRARGYQKGRPDHERPRPVAIAKPAHDDHGGHSGQKREGVGKGYVASFPSELRDKGIYENPK